jgi:hypothetical protein
VENILERLAPAGLSLSPEHVYTLNRHRVDGVTSVINGVLRIEYGDSAEAAREYGTAVHEEIAACLEANFPPGMGHAAPETRAALAYVDTLGIGKDDLVLTEVLLYNPGYEYAGTADFVVIKKRADDAEHIIVRDWKTGAKRPEHAIQGAAYGLAIRAALSVIPNVGTVYLDGAQWRVETYEKTHRSDTDDWLALLRAKRLKERINP